MLRWYGIFCSVCLVHRGPLIINAIINYRRPPRRYSKSSMHVIVGRLLNSSERIEPKHLKNTRFILERGTPAAWRQRVDITVQLCTCVDYMSLSAQYSVNRASLCWKLSPCTSSTPVIPMSRGICITVLVPRSLPYTRYPRRISILWL